MLDKADKLGRWLENALLTSLLLAMMGLGAAQILLRWSGEGSFIWSDEAVRLMVLWIAMIAGVAAAREDRHIAIDVLARGLSQRGRVYAAAVVNLFTVVVCFALAWYALEMVGYTIEDGDTLLSGMPLWWFQSVMPVGFFLMGYRYTIWFYRHLREALRPGEGA
ncbi:MAG: TRAP transporter small permease [Gammaproteobacteria bacterium]|nr:TRAP transporter small permease [Gammaproteobacteria bacterium]MCP4091144.1 TRAP transporter small permease [Gammaproteobacteria bacterium]MCP4277330.1 TRAP transporter small permease [Gammaproteobacteria bacterium]MCP4831609.1 TRAP transporter small permease [Gammaproteobacteria bacterium]MCP4927832.1 TRAP transporter small permease [Gammaproteobacteria bacterium]